MHDAMMVFIIRYYKVEKRALIFEKSAAALRGVRYINPP